MNLFILFGGFKLVNYYINSRIQELLDKKEFITVKMAEELQSIHDDIEILRSSLLVVESKLEQITYDISSISLQEIESRINKQIDNITNLYNDLR